MQQPKKKSLKKALIAGGLVMAAGGVIGNVTVGDSVLYQTCSADVLTDGECSWDDSNFLSFYDRGSVFGDFDPIDDESRYDVGVFESDVQPIIDDGGSVKTIMEFGYGTDLGLLASTPLAALTAVGAYNISDKTVKIPKISIPKLPKKKKYIPTIKDLKESGIEPDEVYDEE